MTGSNPVMALCCSHLTRCHSPPGRRRPLANLFQFPSAQAPSSSMVVRRATRFVDERGILKHMFYVADRM